MIRILYCIATLDPFGAERQLASLVCRLDRSRFEPLVCCLTRGGELEFELKDAGVAVVILRKCCKFDFSVLGPLVRLIRSRKIDIVHTWLFTANAFGRAGAFLARAPVIIASERVAYPRKGFLHSFVDHALSYVTDGVVCNASLVLKNCRDTLKIPPEKLVLITNGVDVDAFHPAHSRQEVRNELNVASDEFLLCAAGRLDEQKRFDLFIQSAAILRSRGFPVRAVIAGEGHLRHFLEQTINSLELQSHVRLLGYRPDLNEIIAASDLFALSSAYEGMPNVVLESMALETPVVATSVSGIPDLITDGQTGVIIAGPVTPASIAAAVESVLTAPDRGRALAQNARARVVEDFTLDKMVARHEQLYEDLLRAKRRFPKGA